MNQKFLLGALVSVLLTMTATSASADAGNARLAGEPAGSGAGGRTVAIGSGTSYVNVTNGEVVKFVIGDKAFSWAFDGANTISEIDLNKLTPPGTLDHLVKVYVARAPGDGA